MATWSSDNHRLSPLTPAPKASRVILTPWRAFTCDFIPNKVLAWLQSVIEFGKGEYLQNADNAVRARLEQLGTEEEEMLQKKILEKYLSLQTPLEKFTYLCTIKESSPEDLQKSHLLEVADLIRISVGNVFTLPAG